MRAAQSFRILLAEDNQINQRVGILMLKHVGYTANLASDGEEAVEAHRAHPYDVILMDCQMPVMDGFQATRRIRELKDSQPVIIAVTAHAFTGEREKCLSKGMDDYLSKPFTAAQLLATLGKAINTAAVRSRTALERA